MRKPRITRDEWLAGIDGHIEPGGERGECAEWTGPFYQGVPVVYCPRDYIFEGSARERKSVRMTLLALDRGCPPADQIIRPRCLNHRCVLQAHFLILDRKRQAAEQARRGELQTLKARAAKMRARRADSPLTQVAVEQIRASLLPSKQEAALHGVSAATVNAVRRFDVWAPFVAAASVFSYRGSALEESLK